MTKRILLSMLLIGVAIAGVTSATIAYFSDLNVKSGNTFATGTVTLNEDYFGSTPLNYSNLIPGVPQTQQVSFQYTGSINADVYVGTKGTLGPGQQGYLADKLHITITEPSIKVWFDGRVDEVAGAWQKIAENVGQNVWKTYDVTLTLDQNVDDSYQGINNSDTKILLYAVQQGGAVPTTPPYQTP